MRHEGAALFRRLGGGGRFAVLLILRAPFDALYTFVLASFLQYGFDAITSGDAGRLLRVCLVSALAILALFLYNGTVWTVYATYGVRVTARLRRLLFGHMLALPPVALEARPSGEWHTRLNADVQSATAIVNGALHLPHLACAAVNIAVSSVLLARMNPAIFALVLLFVVPHILLSQRFIARPMTDLARRAQEDTAANTTDLNTIVTCAETALLYDAQGYLLGRFEQSSLRLRRANMAMRLRGALGGGLLPLLGMSGYLIILLAGGRWIAEGSLTFGALTAAFQYRGGVLIGMMMALNSIVNCRASLAGIKRVNETLSEPVEEDEPWKSRI